MNTQMWEIEFVLNFCVQFLCIHTLSISLCADDVMLCIKPNVLF